MNKTLMTMTLLLLMGIMPVGAADFASKRLQSIAMSLRLSGLDTLHSGKADDVARVGR